LLFVLLLTVTISGSLMYMLENEQQPESFTSIPAAMWWAIETLTTVGYGDMVPVTIAGRIVGGAVSIIGIGTLALFSGLITVGFLDQLKIYREQHPRATAGTVVAVAEKTITIRQSYREHAVTERERTDIAAIQSERGDPLSPLSGTCPHCGSAIAYSAMRGGARNEPFGA
jgi:voltage-gated potassium channel